MSVDNSVKEYAVALSLGCDLKKVFVTSEQHAPQAFSMFEDGLIVVTLPRFILHCDDVHSTQLQSAGNRERDLLVHVK